MEAVSLSDSASAQLEHQIGDLPSPYDELEDFLLAVYPLFATLPAGVRRSLRAVRNDPEAPGALLIDNLPVEVDPPPTPTSSDQAVDKKVFVAEACALGAAQVLGEPVGYREERGGAIVQWLHPIATEATKTSSDSFEIDLGFHTDFNFDSEHPDAPFNVINPDFVVLTAVRADPNAEARTMYVEARRLCEHLTEEERAILREPLFEFRASYSFSGGCEDDRAWSRSSPILAGPTTCPELSVDLLCGTRGVTPPASAALDALRQAAHRPGVAESVHLRPGQVLVMDNRKGAHGRTAFTAYFDGTDRWVERVYVRRSIWECRKEGRDSYHVI